MRRTLPSQLFRPEHNGGFLGRVTAAHQGGVAAELLSVLTSAPGCLEEFWSTIEPAYTAGIVSQAAKAVRTAASLVSRDAPMLPDHMKWLDERGYSREDNRQIRYVVEACFHTEPCQAVLAAVAHRWVLGLSSPALAIRNARANGDGNPRFGGQMEVVDEDHIPPCLDPVAARYGLPIHSFFRALAVWPEYLQKVWADLDPVRIGFIYPAMLADLRQTIDESSRRVPILREITLLGEGPLDIARSIQQYLDVSCEVILHISALRRMFIRSETLARNRRIRQSLEDRCC